MLARMLGWSISVEGVSAARLPAMQANEQANRMPQPLLPTVVTTARGRDQGKYDQNDSWRS